LKKNLKRRRKVDLVGDLLREFLELLVLLLSVTTLVFFRFNLIPVHSTSAATVTRLVNGGVNNLSVKLDVMGFLLVDHDRVPQADVNQHKDLLLAGLENEVLDVAVHNVWEGEE